MEELFATLPELPEGFKDWCYSFLPEIAIYYKRKGKIAECQCGKCGKHYTVNEQPSRNEKAICPRCKNEGFYEWKKVKHGRWFDEGIFLVQSTTGGNLVVRYFFLKQYFRQGRSADIELVEMKRIFLTLGDVYRFNNEERWCGGRGWKRSWREGKGNSPMEDGEIYSNWREEIKKSCLKYCDVDEIQRMTQRAKINILIAFAKNPALEMYVKSGMTKLADHLIGKEGSTKWINRRGKNIKQQLRLKDKQKIKRFIDSGGDIGLLEILLLEEKQNINYTPEEEKFLAKYFVGYYNKKKEITFLLNFMSLKQLMNRIEKYKSQQGYYMDSEIIGRYYDYLNMRQTLGYDMTNEVYLYPKNLKEKHDEMVKEQNARKDELHITKKLKEFPDIAKRYEELYEKYFYKSEGYIIRPAKDAGEIIMEGRKLHHCVGGDNYLRKHDQGKTTILFLRREKSPNRPYYTIEIEGNKILQWYGIRDSKPNKQKIEKWLEGYTNNLETKKKSRKKPLQAAG
jgi:hypothetical protein